MFGQVSKIGLNAGDCIDCGCWVFPEGIVGLFKIACAVGMLHNHHQSYPCRHHSLFIPDHCLSDLVFSLWYHNSSNQKNARLEFNLVTFFIYLADKSI